MAINPPRDKPSTRLGHEISSTKAEDRDIRMAVTWPSPFALVPLSTLSTMLSFFCGMRRIPRSRLTSRMKSQRILWCTYTFRLHVAMSYKTELTRKLTTPLMKEYILLRIPQKFENQFPLPSTECRWTLALVTTIYPTSKKPTITDWLHMFEGQYFPDKY